MPPFDQDINHAIDGFRRGFSDWLNADTAHT
jgi:hypothetical protein